MADGTQRVIDPQDGLVIGGKVVKTTDRFDVINPATALPYATAPRADKAQLDLAVDAAQVAFQSWRTLSWDARADMIHAFADAIEANSSELATLIVLEQGKPLASANGEVTSGVKFLRGLADIRLPDEVVESAGRDVRIVRTPLGVVAAITPWNYPVLIPLWKLAPALVTGNTVILKPAETTPLTALWLGRLAQEHFPPGVLNVITGPGLGQELTRHAGIRKISFTGSSTTGQHVLRASAEDFKRVTLEMGGNDAAILLPGFDLNVQGPQLFNSAFANMGQVCVAIKRLIVHDSLYDGVCAALRVEADKLVIGDGMTTGVTAGPVQNEQSFREVGDLIARAQEFGTIVHQIKAPDGPGYFLAPTIVGDVDPNSQLWREEPFGPILPIVRYSDIEDAIALANDDKFGLGGSVWSSDPAEAASVARRLDAGTVWTNTHPAMSPNIPLPGIKMSGVGVEFSHHGLAEFTDLRVHNFATAI